MGRGRDEAVRGKAVSGQRDREVGGLAYPRVRTDGPGAPGTGNRCPATDD
jgi:hypothetical protein